MSYCFVKCSKCETKNATKSATLYATSWYVEECYVKPTQIICVVAYCQLNDRIEPEHNASCLTLYMLTKAHTNQRAFKGYISLRFIFQTLERSRPKILSRSSRICHLVTCVPSNKMCETKTNTKREHL